MFLADSFPGPLSLRTLSLQWNFSISSLQLVWAVNAVNGDGVPVHLAAEHAWPALKKYGIRYQLELEAPIGELLRQSKLKTSSGLSSDSESPTSNQYRTTSRLDSLCLIILAHAIGGTLCCALSMADSEISTPRRPAACSTGLE